MITQTVLDYVRRLSILHDLIRSQDTGGIRDLAVRLHVSERTVRNYIDELKSLGASVSFSRNKNSYCYVRDFELKLTFEVSIDGVPSTLQAVHSNK